MKKKQPVGALALLKMAVALCSAGASAAAWAAPFGCGAQTVSASITAQTRTSVTFSFYQGSGTGGAQPWVTLYTANNRMLRSANGSAVQCQARGGSSCSATYTASAPFNGQVWAGSSLRANADNPIFHSWCSGPLAINLDPTPAGCTISQNTNRTIPVGNFTDRDFRGIGTSTPSKPFTLGLQCTPNTNVSIRVTGTRVADASRGLISVTGGAGGVAIQLLDAANTPVSLGAVRDYGQHGPGWDPGYNVRYYQTAARITPGDANGMVTFTLEYR